MTKFEVLTQAGKIVDAQIAQRRPEFGETLKAAHSTLGELVIASRAVKADEGVSAEFSGGILGVVRNLMAFRSGYASNDESQQIDNPESNLMKSEKRVPLPEFVAYAKTQVEKSTKEEAPEALARLRTLKNVINFGGKEGIKKGEEDISSGVLIPTDNDPDALRTTTAPGSLAPSGTSEPSTAASNFATNPGDVSGAASQADGPASGTSIVGSAGAGTGGAPGESTFATGPGGATAAGPESSTANVQTAANGSTNSGDTGAASFSPDAVQKSVEELQKAAEKSTKDRDTNVGWSMDLNSREFRTNTRRVDFGRDRSPPSK